MATKRMRWAALGGVLITLVAGVSSAAILHGSDGSPVVVAADAGHAALGETPTATGATVSTAVPIETTTTTLVVTVPAPTSSVRPTTAATAPPPPVTAPPTTSATTAPTTTSPPRATTTVAAGPATVTLVNTYPEPVFVTINGQTWDLAVGQQIAGVKIMPAPSGNDAITVGTKSTPTCGIGDAMTYFRANQAFTFTVTSSGGGTCGPPNSRPGPNFTVTPA